MRDGLAFTVETKGATMAKDTAIRGEASFEARLATYGLGRDAVNTEVLRVTRQSIVRLDSGGKGVAPARWLRPSSLSQLKEWIGVPQSVVSKNTDKFVGRRVGKLPPADLHERLEKDVVGAAAGSCTKRRSIDPGVKQYGSAIQDVLRQYIYGDARELAALEPLIGLNVVPDFPFWLFNRVHVEQGGMLEFGPGMNVLVADTLIIENGGEIRSAGSLKINCRRMSRS
jgi:hypothetical protein